MILVSAETVAVGLVGAGQREPAWEFEEELGSGLLETLATVQQGYGAEKGSGRQGKKEVPPLHSPVAELAESEVRILAELVLGVLISELDATLEFVWHVVEERRAEAAGEVVVIPPEEAEVSVRGPYP